MADAAVTLLLEKVTALLKHYGCLMIGDAEYELQQLKRELNSLKALLVKAAPKSRKGELFKQMDRQMRDVVYEVEDALDTCLTQAVAAKAEEGKLAAGNFDLAKEIKSLRQDKVKRMIEKAAEVEFAYMQVGDESVLDDEEPPAVLRKDQAIRRDRFVGFEDEQETITYYLMEKREKLEVIPIIGMAGLGKSTLVRNVFESPKIQYEYHTRIWVNVSPKLNEKELFLKILKEFTSEDMSSLSGQELVQEVRACLENEMFLIVFDDVWTVDDWNTIKGVLPMSNGMAKVIITSRNTEVGINASFRGPHQLRFFNVGESWNLFQLEVFEDLGDCPAELVAIGQHVARNCGGLPLTILLIAGILLDLYRRPLPMGRIKDEWIKVSEKVTHFVKMDMDKHIYDVIALSYNMLRDESRECLVYTGVFPEDHEIEAWTLTRLWIAEGFIQNKIGQSLEETVEEYLDDLINRNLLMVRRANSMGEKKACRVDNATRAFCNSKAAEQNLFQVIKKSKEGYFEQPIQNYRRICFHSDGLSNFLSEKPKGPIVRSFLCFPEEPIDLEMQYITAIPDAFGLLRVLDSKSIKFDLFPTKLIQLIHLRYVTLRVDDLRILPEPISQLWNLQTLVVETNTRTLTMKANIWRMVWLRHLKTKAAIVLDPNWDGEAGENLQTVSRLSPESCSDSVSKRARNIRELGICGNLATLFNNNINKFLENLHRLEKLKLVNDVYYEAAIQKDYCKLIRLPEYNRFPPNLRRLTLTKTSLDWSIMSTTLSKIETLEVLKLKDNAFSGLVWRAAGDGFPRLKFLLIEEADIVIWEASADHFPSLTFLSIKNCRSLKTIPHEMAKGSLQKLDIDFLGRSATDSARGIQKLNEKEQEHEQNVPWGVRFQLTVGSGCES